MGNTSAHPTLAQVGLTPYSSLPPAAPDRDARELTHDSLTPPLSPETTNTDNTDILKDLPTATSNLYSPIAQAGFIAPALYDKHRPSYKAQAVDHILEELGVTDGKTHILELGAGTGKLTEKLSALPGDHVIYALEPHREMRAFLAEKKLRNVKAIEGLAQSIPLPKSSVDCVIVAQAFHWFSNVESLREIHRVMKPNGGLGLMWNMEDYNSPRSLQVQTNWEFQLREVIWDLDDGQPRFKSEVWQSVFDNPEIQPLFHLPLSMKTWRDTHCITATDLEHRILSYCMLQSASLEKRNLLRQRIQSILGNSKTDGSQGTDELQMRVSTIVAWTRKI